MIKLIKSAFYNEVDTREKLAEFISETTTFSMGPQCQLFERGFALKQQRKHAVFVANGSVANLLLIQAMLNSGKLAPGDKVGFSALTWPTNVMPLLQLGLQPVAIDCELTTFNVSPRRLLEQVEGLNCLFLTNVLGFCDDLVTIKDICDQFGIALIEDNCESLGSRLAGVPLGNFGEAATFSFFIGHHLSTIEGGMVVTDNDELYEYLVMGRSHGWDRNLPQDSQIRLRTDAGVDDFYAQYTFYDLASNFRPTEVSGFLGNTQLKYWDEIVNQRSANYTQFHAALEANDDLLDHSVAHMDIISNFAMPIVCKSAKLAAAYRERFVTAGVEIRPIIAGNMTRQPFYRKYIESAVEMPNADMVHTNGFYFGNNPDLKDSELDILTDLLTGNPGCDS